MSIKNETKHNHLPETTLQKNATSFKVTLAKNRKIFDYLCKCKTMYRGPIARINSTPFCSQFAFALLVS